MNTDPANPAARRPSASGGASPSPSFRATALRCATVGLAAAIVSGCVYQRPRELRHTVNGVTMDSDGRAVIDPGKRGANPMTRPVADPWGPPQVGVPGMGEVKAVPVNVFGEMGKPRPLSRVVGDAGFQQHTFTDEGADSDVAADPSGKWLVFSSTRHNEHTDIYMQRADGTAVTQLTSDQADDAFPSFSPDGRKICFASTRAGAWQIYMMDVDGRNVVQVTNGNMQCVHPTFSPDGSRIAYSTIGSRSAQWELWVADLRTGEKRMIGYGLFPRWSPDKSVDRIAFQKSRQRGTRWFSLWSLDLIEGEGRRQTEIVSSPNAAVVSPSWSPDGKRLAFATIVEPARSGAEKDERKLAMQKQYGQQDVWTVDADGGNRQRLTDGNGTNLSPFWAADNRVYFISDRGGAECVWSVRADPKRAFETVNVGPGAVPPPAVPGANAGAGVAPDPFRAGRPGNQASTDPRE